MMSGMIKAEIIPNVFSRRVLLGAFAALPAGAAALVVATPIPAEPAEHPDADLFWLYQELEEAHARTERASKVCSRAGKKYEAALPPPPPDPNEYCENVKWSDEVSAAWDGMTMGDYRAGRLPAAYQSYEWAKEKEIAIRRAARDKYETERKELSRKFKINALEKAFDDLVDEMFKVGDRIFATPANTLEGMVIKIRTADRLDLKSFAGNDAFVSIAADIRRLAGEVA
ncbi:hypothetical protein [Mesorhizobium sp. M0522]|uniref:hypothetical protein n=1 Tax=Mesorhizobium sp. M0522 TaxID=2956958 RepID=UPI003337F38A